MGGSSQHFLDLHPSELDMFGPRRGVIQSLSRLLMYSLSMKFTDRNSSRIDTINQRNRCVNFFDMSKKFQFNDFIVSKTILECCIVVALC